MQNLRHRRLHVSWLIFHAENCCNFWLQGLEKPDISLLK
jgi:hypothetical protein